MRITPHFTRKELECKCGCGKDTVDVELAKVLNLCRLHFNKPVKVTSGNRCKKHNKAVGGKKNSLHLVSKAADIKVKDVSAKKVQSYFKSMYPDKYGIGSYKTFTHIDVRLTKVRWEG